MGVKFREMGATSPGEASWSWAACFLLSRNLEGIKRNTSTLGMAQLWEKWTLSRKASGILHGAVLLRMGTTTGGGYGNSSWGKWLRRFLLYFTQSWQSFLRHPSSPEIPCSHTESKISEWGWKGSWNKDPRTLLPFHRGGNWDSEGERD